MEASTEAITEATMADTTEATMEATMEAVTMEATEVKLMHDKVPTGIKKTCRPQFLLTAFPVSLFFLVQHSVYFGYMADSYGLSEYVQFKDEFKIKLWQLGCQNRRQTQSGINQTGWK